MEKQMQTTLINHHKMTTNVKTDFSIINLLLLPIIPFYHRDYRNGAIIYATLLITFMLVVILSYFVEQAGYINASTLLLLPIFGLYVYYALNYPKMLIKHLKNNEEYHEFEENSNLDLSTYEIRQNSIKMAFLAGLAMSVVSSLVFLFLVGFFITM